MGPRAYVMGCMLLAATPASAAPKPLATPAIAAGARSFVAFAGRPAVVRIGWAPVAGAVRYRARWFDAAHPVDIMLTAPGLQRTESRTGPHRVAIVAISEHGVESPPAELTLEIVTIVATRAGSETPEPSDGTAFAIGARFSSPGLRCQIGGGVPAAEVIASTPGAAILRCGGEVGQLNAEVPIVITPVIVSAQTAPLRRGTATKIHVSVDGAAR